jgi:hypothetical protein
MTEIVPDTRHIAQEGQRLLNEMQRRFAKADAGKFVAIDVDSGEYFLGATTVEATNNARNKHPDKVFYLGRIGCRTAFTFKGRR